MQFSNTVGEVVGEQGLERKKLETRRAIIRAAFDLVRTHGIEGVTVEDIAGAAGVSRRTFFNYFTSKEQAIVGMDPVVIAEISSQLRVRPINENPIQALRAVLIPSDDPELEEWVLRNELIALHPGLVSRHLEALADFEHALTCSMAERLGFHADRDPRTRMVVAIVLGALRTGIYWWHESDRSQSLRSVIDEAFEMVGDISLTNEELSGPRCDDLVAVVAG